MKENSVCKLGANLHFDLEKEYVTISGGNKTKVQGLQGVPSGKKLWEINSYGDLTLYMYVGWKFINLNRAFSQAVRTSSPSLMVYSNVMRHNVVGDTQLSLVREVAYKK